MATSLRVFSFAMLRVSPVESESDGWLGDTMEGTDARLLDPRPWQSSPSELGPPPSSPLEYRNLFDTGGFVFNTRRSWCCSSNQLQVVKTGSHDLSPSISQPVSPAAFLTGDLTNGMDAPVSLCPSLALLHSIEMDPGIEERELATPRGRFLRAATSLHSRLLDLDCESDCLLYEGLVLRHGFQDLLADTELLVSQTRQLHRDLLDVLHLNDLLWLLQGRLDRVTPRKWPFLQGHDRTSGEVNLVV